MNDHQRSIPQAVKLVANSSQNARRRKRISGYRQRRSGYDLGSREASVVVGEVATHPSEALSVKPAQSALIEDNVIAGFLEELALL